MGTYPDSLSAAAVDRNEHSGGFRVSSTHETAWTACGQPEFIATSLGPQVKDGLIFLYQAFLTGNPVVGEAELKNEAGWLALEQRRVRPL